MNFRKGYQAWVKLRSKWKWSMLGIYETPEGAQHRIDILNKKKALDDWAVVEVMASW